VNALVERDLGPGPSSEGREQRKKRAGKRDQSSLRQNIHDVYHCRPPEHVHFSP